MYQLSSRQMSSQIGDEVVILDHADGIYFNLENVGATVWNKLQEGPQDFETLVTEVCAVFDTDTESCKADIQSFIDDLVKKKLVIIT
jgi:Coenzyme PQQ synthesis protein D (PqqD)